jgi:aspartokinase
MIEKPGLNEIPQTRTQILNLFAEQGIGVKNILSGIDSVTIVAEKMELLEGEEKIRAGLTERIQPTQITITHDVAIIAIVGRELFEGPGMAVKVLGALANRKINIRMIDHGSERINMLLGVDEADYVAAIQAIYQEFTRA